MDEDRSGANLDCESQEYFRRREEAERQAAKHAASEPARRAHEKLAHEYAALLSRSSSLTIRSNSLPEGKPAFTH
jgi:hypothetical protein